MNLWLAAQMTRANVSTGAGLYAARLDFLIFIPATTSFTSVKEL